MADSSVCIALGADHRGYALKEFLKQNLAYDWIDVGTMSDQRTDYPLFAYAVVDRIIRKEARCGILICGSGAGMTIAANRYQTMRAATVWNVEVARAVKADDNCNILVIPADFVSNEDAIELIQIWQKTEFKGGHYQERLLMIDL